MIYFFAGARPNFVKVAPVYNAFTGRKAFIHTGQHYDSSMSSSFIEKLDLPVDRHLGFVRHGSSHATQLAHVAVQTEKLLEAHRPDAVLVPGDVNASAAVALTASKLNIPVIHLEAGLRSDDLSMPEEQNRKVIDAVSTYYLTTCDDATQNLVREGIAPRDIRQCGNTMIDTLVQRLPNALSTWQNGFDDFVLVTLHRPSLVDDREQLNGVLDLLEQVAEHHSVVFPLHPRTRSKVQASLRSHRHVRYCEPFDYDKFIAHLARARLVITDSGGVQEETTFLGVPCITYRTTTERPITLREGTNFLATNLPDLESSVRTFLRKPIRSRPHILGWDGKAGPRAAEAIEMFMERTQ